MLQLILSVTSCLSLTKVSDKLQQLACLRDLDTNRALIILVNCFPFMPTKLLQGGIEQFAFQHKLSFLDIWSDLGWTK